MPELHSISFIWPRLLWLQLALPMLALAYAGWLWHSGRRSQVWPSQMPADQRGSRLWRQGLTGLSLAIGLALLLLAVARPRAILLLPGWTDTVMLVIDSSGSMRADDIKPSRIEAAQAAARTFIDAQPRQVRMGIVSAAGAAAVVQGPTDDRDALRQALDGLALQRGTALGSGIVIALSALLPGAGIDVQALLNEEQRPKPATGTPLPDANDKAKAKPKRPPVEPGSNKATAIVLLSDGQSNFGPDLLKMAELAASHGVRIYTVGMGTPEGVVLKANGMSMRVRLDEAALEKVANITQGEYFRASSHNELVRIYSALSRNISLQKHQLSEVSALVALLGLIWVTVGASLSFWRHGRVF